VVNSFKKLFFHAILWLCILFLNSVNANNEFKKIFQSAQQRNIEAQFNIANMYREGNGVAKNYAEAFKWYKKAAEQGFMFAQYELGNLYEHGQGVTKSYTKALKLYQQSANQGCILAKKKLNSSKRK
jgi:uncharacterized protein